MIEGAHGAAVVVDPPESEVHYPEGEPVPEGERHSRQCTEVVLALRDWLRQQPRGDRTWVGDNINIYYTEGDNRDVIAPDVAVAFGIDVAAQEHNTVYKVWETGTTPAWVLEVASASTVRGDVHDKPDIYAAVGVTEYWRADPTAGDLLDPPLQGDRLTGAHRRPITINADADGTLRGHSDVLGLDVCWQDGELRLYDPATGTPLLTHDDLVTAHIDAETRATAAVARAERAEVELAALRRRLDPRR